MKLIFSPKFAEQRGLALSKKYFYLFVSYSRKNLRTQSLCNQPKSTPRSVCSIVKKKMCFLFIYQKDVRKCMDMACDPIHFGRKQLSLCRSSQLSHYPHSQLHPPTGTLSYSLNFIQILKMIQKVDASTYRNFLCCGGGFCHKFIL